MGMNNSGRAIHIKELHMCYISLFLLNLLHMRHLFPASPRYTSSVLTSMIQVSFVFLFEPVLYGGRCLNIGMKSWILGSFSQSILVRDVDEITGLLTDGSMGK